MGCRPDPRQGGEGAGQPAVGSVLINHSSCWTCFGGRAGASPGYSPRRDRPLAGVRWLAIVVGTLFVERGRRHAVSAPTRQGRTAALGQLMGCSGTTTDGSRLLPFHANWCSRDRPECAFVARSGCALHSVAIFPGPRFRRRNEPECSRCGGSSRRRTAVECTGCRRSSQCLPTASAARVGAPAIAARSTVPLTSASCLRATQRGAETRTRNWTAVRSGQLSAVNASPTGSGVQADRVRPQHQSSVDQWRRRWRVPAGALRVIEPAIRWGPRSRALA